LGDDVESRGDRMALTALITAVLVAVARERADRHAFLDAVEALACKDADVFERIEPSDRKTAVAEIARDTIGAILATVREQVFIDPAP
jgi:hypothetical protein